VRWALLLALVGCKAHHPFACSGDTFRCTASLEDCGRLCAPHDWAVCAWVNEAGVDQRLACAPTQGSCLKLPERMSDCNLLTAWPEDLYRPIDSK
jgi:hypothetical protein